MSLFPVEAFEYYWTMWNERDASRVRDHLDRAVTDDFIFCDPVHFHVGREALHDNVRQLRLEYPDAEFVPASGVDTHHNRFRYHWNFLRRGRVFVRGLDIATVNDDGMIERIDGFFGPVPDLPPSGS